MNTIKNILLFAIMLTAIISIHEFGHFIFAKLFNVYVSEFSIGMGKPLFQKKGKETAYSIRLLPIGGYCAMAGEDNVDSEGIPFERTLNGIAKWKRIIILIAGAFNNVLLAIFVVAMVYLSMGQATTSLKPVINEVQINSPAYNAGLKENDYIRKISLENGYSLSIKEFDDISDIMALYDGGTIEIVVDRDGEIKNISLVPEYVKEEGRYLIGISSSQYEIVDINIFNCFSYSLRYIVSMTKIIFITLLGLFRGVGLNNLSGPVGIYSATSSAVETGMSTYFILVGLLSLNIGLFNLIPIPALDGGRVVMTFIEMIIKRPIPKKIEQGLTIASVVLFLAIFMFSTFHDVFKLFVG